jgi:hypothetical protein
VSIEPCRHFLHELNNGFKPVHVKYDVRFERLQGMTRGTSGGISSCTAATGKLQILHVCCENFPAKGLYPCSKVNSAAMHGIAIAKTGVSGCRLPTGGQQVLQVRYGVLTAVARDKKKD